MRSLITIFSLVIIASCSPRLSYYTKDIHNNARWDDKDLSKIQFYVSDDIILWRDVNRGEAIIDEGKIKMVEGREVEEVIIKSGTPGVFVFSPKKKEYAICFDPKDDSKFLIFGPSEKVNDRYVLLAKDWDKRYGKITYGDKLYRTSAQSAFSYLMVDLSKATNTKVNAEKPKGRKVNGAL